MVTQFLRKVSCHDIGIFIFRSMFQILLNLGQNHEENRILFVVLMYSLYPVNTLNISNVELQSFKDCHENNL